MQLETRTSGKVNGGRSENRSFDHGHYRKADIPYSPLRGMPGPGVYEIMNNLNRNQDEHRFVYHLAEWLNGQVR